MKSELNIQDGFLFSHLKSNTDVEITLIHGEPFKARVIRFDRYMIMVVADGRALSIYKHAIVCIKGAPVHTLR